MLLLYNYLKKNLIKAACLDVFKNEPYSGKLLNLNNCFFTSHMGSMSFDCRSQMEIEATQQAVSFLEGKDIKNRIV